MHCAYQNPITSKPNYMQGYDTIRLICMYPAPTHHSTFVFSCLPLSADHLQYQEAWEPI